MPAVDAVAPHVELEASLPDDAAGYAARVHADAHRDVDPLGLTHDGHHLLLRARVRVKKARAARAEARVEEARVETRAEARVGARVEGRGKVGSGWVGVGEEFDRLCDENDVDKIKTIGDAYIVCAGALNELRADDAARVVRMGLAMQANLHPS